MMPKGMYHLFGSDAERIWQKHVDEREAEEARLRRLQEAADE